MYVCHIKEVLIITIYLSSISPSMLTLPTNSTYSFSGNLGPVVQSVISLTSSLRVISLTVLTDSIYNILIFFAEKM